MYFYSSLCFMKEYSDNKTSMRFMIHVLSIFAVLFVSLVTSDPNDSNSNWIKKYNF